MITDNRPAALSTLPSLPVPSAYAQGILALFR
jgi:hypothetical protein